MIINGEFHCHLSIVILVNILMLDGCLVASVTVSAIKRSSYPISSFVLSRSTPSS